MIYCLVYGNCPGQKNISNTAEYLGISHSGLNHNFWKLGSSSFTGEYDLTFFPDGRISISTSLEDSLFDGALGFLFDNTEHLPIGWSD